MRAAVIRTDFRRRRETDFWQGINRLMAYLIVAAFLAWIVFAFRPESQRIAEMRQTWEALKQEVAAEELLLRKQQREDAWLKSDPEYVETLARDRLELMKDGETIYRLDSPHAPAEPIPALPQ